MTNFNTSFTRFVALFVVTSLLLASCKDPEPGGPASALGKQFTLAVPPVTSSIAYSLTVSPDGTKMIAAMHDNNTDIYYSSDGGTSFNQVYGNTIAPRVVDIDNLGNILTYENRVVNSTDNPNNVYITGDGYNDQLMLGSKGKVFLYNSSSDLIKQRDIANGDWATVAAPSAPKPGAGHYVMKAVGKGILYLEASGSATITATAWFLDETTLQWSNPVDFSIDYNALNSSCNPLNRYVRYSYAGQNTIIAKGCSGTALLDVSNSNVKNIEYPTDENLVYEDLRDGKLVVDSKKQIYALARQSADLSTTLAYRYDGTKWELLPDFLSLGLNSMFTSDQVDNIYFNSADGAGKSFKGTIKINVTTGTKTGLSLATEELTVKDAARIDGDHMMIVVDGFLYNYDIATGIPSNMGLSNVTHINILSDGRWIAGGQDHLYISNDKGSNWTETKKIFSSVDPKVGGASVVMSRIVNNKLLINGSQHSTYYNQATGQTQDKYDNIMIEFDGSTATKSQYTFPNDFVTTAIGPDGTIYGYGLYYDGINIFSDYYEFKSGITPERITGQKGGAPSIVTDDGLQIAIASAKSGGGFEVVTRKSHTEEYQSTNTPLPNDATSYGMFLRQSGDKLLFISSSKIYVSGN